MASNSRSHGRGSRMGRPHGSHANASAGDDLCNSTLAHLQASDRLNRHQTSRVCMADEVVGSLQDKIHRAKDTEERLQEEVRAWQRMAADAKAQIRTAYVVVGCLHNEINRAKDTEARLQAEVRSWQRKTADAEAQIRTADEVVKSLHDEIRHKKDTEAQLQAEIRKHMAVDAKACLENEVGWDGCANEQADGRREEASEVVAGKRKLIAGDKDAEYVSGCEASRRNKNARKHRNRKTGVSFYQMVLKALKEKERELLAAEAAKPNYRCWLHLGRPSESAEDVEDLDPHAPQQ